MNRIIICKTCKMQRNIETNPHCPICFLPSAISEVSEDTFHIQGIANLVKGMMYHLFNTIDSPASILGSEPDFKKKPHEYTLYQRRYKNWLQKTIDWAQEKDNWWLGAFEQLFNYDEERVANLLIKKAKQALKRQNLLGERTTKLQTDSWKFFSHIKFKFPDEK